MSNPPASTMMTFHIPPDRELLAAVGEIALQHSALDHILRMTIKTQAEVTIKQAENATAFQGSRVLERRIRKLARSRLGENSARIQLQDLLLRCRRATTKRNELVHNIWAQELDGEPKVRTADQSWAPIPTVDELKAIAKELESLRNELNYARLHGFLATAIAASANAP